MRLNYVKCSPDLCSPSLPGGRAIPGPGLREDMGVCAYLRVDTCLGLARSSENDSHRLELFGEWKRAMELHELPFPTPLPTVLGNVNGLCPSQFCSWNLPESGNGALCKVVWTHGPVREPRRLQLRPKEQAGPSPPSRA